MKKQSDIHMPSRVRESETVIDNIPAPAFTESLPKGVHDYVHPTHISHGAAESQTDESQTDPVKDKPPVSDSKDRA